MSSLYIHIPFCQSKCHYCAFNSYSKLEPLFDRYFLALRKELEGLKVDQPFKTIFFGGGTPTILGADRLAELVRVCDKHSIEPEPEITVEANPETINEEGLRTLRGAGINRISFGVQSFKDADLTILGRTHSAKRAIEAVKEAQDAGFDNINLDLMSALPGQTVASWLEVLNIAISLEPKHLSIYQLTPEEDTKFYNQYVSGDIVLPDEQLSLEMDQITKEICAANGFMQYEISNYAKKESRCLHNINYWQNNDYYAVGAGAVSYLKGFREKRVDSPEEYCRRLEIDQSVVVDSEVLDQTTSFRETVIMGLRMVEGVSVESLKRRYKIDPISYYGDIWQQLERKGFVEVRGGNLRITESGRPLSNSIMADLV